MTEQEQFTDEPTSTTFRVPCEISVAINAGDIVAQLTPHQVMDLIEELEARSESWPLTILLSRRFRELAEQAKGTAPDLWSMPDEDLERELEEEPADDGPVVPDHLQLEAE